MAEGSKMFKEGLKNKITDSDNKVVEVTRNVMVSVSLNSEPHQHARH